MVREPFVPGPKSDFSFAKTISEMDKFAVRSLEIVFLFTVIRVWKGF